MKYYLLALSCSVSLIVQNALPEFLPEQIHVDSLKTHLEGTTGTERLVLLTDLVETLYDKDAKQAILYGREAVSLFQKNTEHNIIRQIWYQKAQSHEMIGENDSVLVHAEKLETWAKTADDGLGLAHAAYLKGLVYSNRGAYKESKEAFTIALNGYESIDEMSGMANALHNIGNIHIRQGVYGEALSLHTRVLAIREEIDDKGGMAGSLNSIGAIHYMQGSYEESLTYFARSLTIREEIGDKGFIAGSLTNIGNIHYRRGDYEESLSFYTRALGLQIYTTTLVTSIRNKAFMLNRSPLIPWP